MSRRPSLMVSHVTRNSRKPTAGGNPNTWLMPYEKMRPLVRLPMAL